MNTARTIKIKETADPVISVWLVTVLDGEIITCDVCRGGYEQLYILRTSAQVFTVCGDCFDNTVEKEE